MNMREFIGVLDEKGLLKRVKKPMSVKYEIPTLMKLMDGTALLFENPEGFSMPIAANICSSRELVAAGLGIKKEELIQRLAGAIDDPHKPEVVGAEEYNEVPADLSQLPILTYYPFDGGPYIASGVVISRDPELGMNASYHRMMVIDKDHMVLRILQRNFDKILERGSTEFAICIGSPMPVLVASAVSVPLGECELNVANALSDIKLVELGSHTVPEAEIVMIAEMTGEMHDEGPFLDLTETPDIVRQQRVARIKQMFLREGAVFHGLLPGGLEHKLLMGMPREPTIFREVSKVCECADVSVTPGGCSWLHGAVAIRKKSADDGRKAIEAAFRGHTSMKHVFVVDDDIDIHDPNEIEWAMATRFQGDIDMIIKPNEKGSSLDPSSNLETRETAKIGFDLTMPWGRKPEEFKKPELPLKMKIGDYLE